MADVKKDTILLEIETNFGDVINEMAQLTTRIDNLKSANKSLIDNNKKLQEEMKKDATVREKNTKLIEINNQEIQQNEVIIRNLGQRQREYRKEIDDQIKAHQENEGSIKQMRLELIKMRKEYESLSKADRESQDGKDMLDNIATMTEELKTLEKEQGDFRREVGHYENALNNLDPKLAKALEGFRKLSGGTMQVGVAFKNAIPKLKAFGTQLLKLAVNPVVLAILAVVTALKKLVDQFKMNDDAMTALQQLFASFQPIIDVFVAGLDAVVKALTKVIGGITKGVTALMSLIPAFKASSEAAQDYVKSMDVLEDKEREYGVQVAKNEAEISELRAKSIQKDKYTAEQRKKFLEEAGNLEKENLRMEKEIAEEKLRLAKDDAKRRRDTSDATKNNIADLEANVWRAVKTYNDGMRSIVKATQKAMKEIDKEVNKDITLPQFKQQKKHLEQAVADAKKVFESTNYNGTNMFGQITFNVNLYEENKRNLEQAEADLNNFVDANEETARRNSKELQSIAKDRYENLLQARKDYEQAVIDLMDETLEKQLKMIDEQYRQEVEALKKKLATEENLTKEARELIQKTIELKEKKYNENRILAEAKYWSEVRKEAFDALREIGEFRNKVINSDPNRVRTQLSDDIILEMRKIYDEYETQSADLTARYITIFNGMSDKMKEILKGDTSAYTENVVKMMNAILQNQGAFTKENLKSLDGYLVAFEQMREELKFTSSDFQQFTNALYPYSKAIDEMFQTLLQMPQRYTEYATNMIFNKTSEWAKKIRENILKQFDFAGVTGEVKNEITDIVKEADKIIQESWTAAQVRNEFEIGVKVGEKVDFQEVPIEFTFDEKQYKEFTDKWGTKLSRSLSGILETLSGEADSDKQLDWLVKNYEVAIKKIEELNKDLAEQYQLTNNPDFYNARIDESVVIPSLRKIYEMATQANDAQLEYETKRIEIQGKYTDNGDRELLIQKELLELEKKRIETEKSQNENRITYLENIRGEVKELSDEYNSQLLKSNKAIAMANEQLLILENERMSFDENTPEETVQKNAEMTEQFKKFIDDQQKLVQEALEKLSETGFLSVEELDKVLQGLKNSVASANNDIVQNTAEQTQTVTQLWLNSFNRVASGMGQITQAFNSLFNEMGEINDRWNAFAEATAYFSIGLSMAEGIAGAVAEGINSGPFPYNIAAIAAGIAAVVSGIAEAMSVYNQYHKPKYAKGGYVSGEKGVDKINAWLSDGEYVIKRKRVKELGVPFLDALNEGKSVIGRTHFAEGGYVSQATTSAMNDAMQNEMMTNMMVEAMSQIQPIVSVREITNVQNKVRTKETIARK